MTEVATGAPARHSGQPAAPTAATGGTAAGPQAGGSADATPADGTPADGGPADGGPADGGSAAGIPAAGGGQPAAGTPATGVEAGPGPAGEVLSRAGEMAGRVTLASGRVASAMVDRLRNNAELAAERGVTRIGDEVVEKIAGIAARDVPGVYDLGGDVARLFASVKERIGLGGGEDGDDRGVSVRLEGGTAVVDVILVVEYGFVVHSVTEKVRAKVISAVENLLGLAVTEVNILVDDVHVPDDAPEAGRVGDDEARAAGYR